MASYQRQNLHANKKKVSISYVIREKEERLHRAGVNSLQYDHYLDRLYSAGRDSVIRIWGFAADDVDVNSAPGRHVNGYDRSKRSTCIDDCYIQSMEHHTDWVNDINLCCDGRNLISVSNDTTIKVWNAHQGFCLSTLRSHKDYAKCLACARDREIVASAGLDRIIYLWDIQALTMLTATKNTVTTKPLDGCKNSIYSLAINQSGTLVASGSTEKVIRLWDPRSRQKLLKLRGHTDNVRSLLFSKDGSMLLSAGSDGTIRLWSISQQRCVSIIRVHNGGVWALQADESFSTVYSGGKDCKIFMTDLKNTSNTKLVCQEQAPILKMLLVNRVYSMGDKQINKADQSIWVSTTDSAIKNWPLMKADDLSKNDLDSVSGDRESLSDGPAHESPDLVIKGNPAVINYHILNDKRHIITQESDNSIALYDVLTARKIDELHPACADSNVRQIYEDEIKRRSKMVYVPNWFTVDLKIGLLCIHLEESECLSAWVSARDYGLAPHVEGQDPKVNLGCLTLQALLEYWPPTFEGYNNDLKSDQHDPVQENVNLNEYNSLQYIPKSNQYANRRRNLMVMDRNQLDSLGQKVGNQYFSIASHTPIIISEGNQTILRFLAHEACNENEDLFIQEIIPPWVGDIVISKCQPKYTKIPFFLLPHSNSGIKSLRKERLSASDMLQMRKVIEHVCEKMLTNLSEETGAPASESNFKGSNHSNEPRTYTADEVELYCNDQRLDENLDLRTVKHYIWKSGGDLVLHYMPLK